MCSQSRRFWITYNGEIYNYLELREQLEKKGYRFYSSTDTEVIVNGYELWGAEVLSKLKGMFAFAIWDEDNKELFAARDRFGIKPLYYYQDQQSFVFASEIKGIKANSEVTTTLDYTSVADYFVYRYVPSPGSIWKEVKKLPTAHYLLLKSNGSLVTKRYWDIPLSEKVISDKEAIERFDELLYNSVRMHMRSDVPVGSFLSGGYDSSALVYYLHRLGFNPSTFSIGFEGWEVSEHIYAEMVAKQYRTNHHSFILQSQSLDTLDNLAEVYDEPNGDISIIPTYLVCREASKHAKAVLSGEGSDEILGGYQWQKDYQPQTLTFKQKLVALFQPSTKSHLLEYYANAMAMGRYDTSELKLLLSKELHSSLQHNPEWYYQSLYRRDLPDLKAMQVLDVKHFMGEQVLVKMDRASMANSLEVRVPFLDHKICEFVFQLKTDVYYRAGETKHLLYQNIKQHLPKEILDRKKQGFVGPDKYYMNIDWYRERLSESRLVRDGILNEPYISSLLNNADHWRLWKVAVMELWYRRWS
jgi:asparagine synthase (glutamine-hydrolysing)